MIHESSYEVVITWGKYKGYTLGRICEFDESYLNWMSNAESVPITWKIAALRTVSGESLSDLSLPRTSSIHKQDDISALSILSDDKKVKIDVRKNKGIVTFPYSPKTLSILKSASESRTWDAKKKEWKISIPDIAKCVKAFGINNVILTEAAAQAAIDEVERRKDLDTIRVKEDSDDIREVLSKKMTMPLYNYQNVAVEFIDRAGGRAMVADYMGLGKTATSIGAAVYYDSKSLIICPNSVKLNWVREVKKFAGQKSIVWDSKQRLVADWSQEHGVTFEKYDGRSHKSLQFSIVNYDIITKLFDQLKEEAFEMLILDECTYVKNHKTKRSKAIFGDGKAKRKFPGLKAKYIILLTGTPVLNRPSEAYTLLHYLSPDRFSNFFAFCQKYGGWMGSPSKNLKELHERTKDLIIRRKNEDVKIERPKKTVTELYIELSDSDTTEYGKLLKQLFRKWTEDKKPTIGTMPKIQQFLISKKLSRLYEIIDEYLESNRSVVVFSTYKAPLKEVYNKYKDIAGEITGDMNIKERQKTIDGIKDGSLKVGCITIGAGKMGIDGMQYGCDTVIFLDMDWTPSNMEQAESRIDRAGQLNPVSVYYLLCNDTIDIYMKETLDEKQKLIDTIVDGAAISMTKEKGMFKDFVRRLKMNYKMDSVDLSDVD